MKVFTQFISLHLTARINGLVECMEVYSVSKINNNIILTYFYDNIGITNINILITHIYLHKLT